MLSKNQIAELRDAVGRIDFDKAIQDAKNMGIEVTEKKLAELEKREMDYMNLREYQEKSKRTLNKDLTDEQLLSNMVFGITGEIGEVVDLLKKHMYQGHELDWLEVREEIGDVMFYIVNLCNVLEIDLESAIEENYDKLLKRYPDGFSEERSINRE